ncbi:MAG TPA: hypothetical protein VK149_13405 [Sideroxyarcus sp.]|nr:hypothetical protein [Sideroxyarcus sp.]
MLLEVEKKAPIENAKAADVRGVIPKLRSYGPSSYASLTDVQGNYLQVAGGGVTCLLEWRDAANRRHYRAHLDAPSKVFPDGTILTFSGGEVKLRADEWLAAPLVEEAFIAFLNGESLPQSIKWRDMTAMFENLA